MSDMMTFPATVEEFMEQYKIVDDEKVYTNGADLVPIFRMMQWFEHVSATDTISRQAAINAICEDGVQLERHAQYSMTMVERKQRDVDILEALPPVSFENHDEIKSYSKDTISRQQAIDAFDGVKVDEENCTEYDIGYNDGIDFAISKLSVLPPAQPEIIRCKDCKHLFNKDDEGGKCWHFNGFSKVVSYDDFCSLAERRTDG